MKHSRVMKQPARVKTIGWIAGLSLLSLAAIGSCGQTERSEPVEPEPSVRVPSEAGPLAEPHFLAAPTRFAPALTDVAPGDHPPTGAETADLDTCATCHEEVSIQWRTSAHAFASFNNPIYRASIERFRAEAGGLDRSRFCAGCHDPALMIDGAMTGTIEAADPRAHIGVGCRSCHGVAEATDDGNGSYTLAAAELPIPELDDPASIEVHRKAMGPARTQCNSCHRAFLGLDTGHPHHINGTDEPGPWHDSSYAGNKLRLDTPVKERDCADCHMPVEVVDDRATDPAIDPSDRTLRSHRFIGGHTWMAAMRGDPKTLARVQEFLTGIASIDVAAIELGGRRHLLGRAIDADARGRMVIDLVVRNLAVGHRFPGGTRDAQDTWLALRVVDQSGRTIAELDDGSDKVHRLRVGIVDEQGTIKLAREVEEFRAPAFDHTIAPRDAVIVRYAVDLPSDAAGPLQVEARLLHRSRSLALADETCRQSKSPEGRAFLAATERMTGTRLDPCGELPVTEISRFVMTLGDPASSSDTRPDHERLWELGLALSHQVQERLPEAREALQAAEQALAEATLPQADRDAAHARILAAIGAIAARQGRVDEALELADRVAALRPDHPFPHLLRGRALARVWRWEQAVPHLELAYAASPGSPSLAGELATALGSAGMHRRALEVAAGALGRRPRDATLLRAQALALRALGDPRAEAALELYFTHREPDVQPHLASDCGEHDPDCARERVPVHVHE